MKALIFISILVLFFSCNDGFHQNLLSNVVDVKGNKYEIICESEDLSLVGEGFYSAVYNFNKKIDINKLINKFPKRYQYRNDWKVIKWNNNISKDKENLFYELFEFVTKNKTIDSTNCFDDSFYELKTNKNLYFSFLFDYNNSNTNIVGVELFIFDLESNQMIFLSNKI